MKEYYIVVTKKCYAKINARDEDDAIDIGYDLLDSSNYDDEDIIDVKCLGESDNLFDDEESDIYYDEAFEYDDEYY